MPLVAPSLLSADFANLERDIAMVNASEADWFHLDVMDGVFVPNISFGFPVIEAVRRHAAKPLDVHLMIVDPGRYVEAFARAGATVLTVHYEACTHLHRTLQAVRAAGMKAGVAVNPHTPVRLLADVLHMADLVCLMSVNPGYGGQRFIARTYAKLGELKEMIAEAGTATLVEIDGGVDTGNAVKLVRAGADVLVAGNAVFSAPDPVRVIAGLKRAESALA
jgi:ribulose-phosphate 3-epimerase